MGIMVLAPSPSWGTTFKDGKISPVQPQCLCMLINEYFNEVFFVFAGLLLVNFAYATTMDRTEVSIGEFSKFAASSGLTTHAGEYGGMVYEAGWLVKANWNWPYTTRRNWCI